MNSEQCLRCGFRESYIPSPIPPRDWAQGQDVLECLRSGQTTLDVDPSPDVVLLQKTISDIDHYLKHLDTLASRARKERGRIVKNLAAKQSLLSPIWRLNRDVLLIIFSYASNAELDRSYTSSSLDINNAPWTFLRVCYWWRHVVSSSPTLWSTLKLVLSRRSGIIPSHALDTVKLHLRLSHNSPMKLIIIDIDYDESPQGDAVISEVISHSDRWEDVCFLAPGPQLRNFSRGFRRLSQLKRLVVTSYGDWDFNVPSNAPKLTSLALHGRGRVSPNMFPTSNLRQFTGYFRDPVEFHTFISVATGLEKLGVQSIDRAVYPNKPPLIPVTLRHLRQLSYLDTVETCPNYLISPALRVLSVMQRVDNITAVAELYNRSHFSLEKLYLCRDCIQFSAASSFVETDAVRNLTYFHLEVDDSTAFDWIIALTVTPSFCLFPNLSELTIVNRLSQGKSLSNPDNAQRFLAMVRSRLVGATKCQYLKSCLRKVTLCVWHPKDAEDIYANGFRAFKEDGLDTIFRVNGNGDSSDDISDGSGRSYWNIGPHICRKIV
ncbi:hypothetical protein EDD18DRAFT_1167039 [Armillaria luteobubalina]|uniref:F-box domain-containing protein n=1 Tax=Armillaria luteobubalina TaxID=153913 RepID=A0AA39UX36_9AGAR|nr:hypothetical protein EDD18DRAFT_1167039 [Armillaria luteobubalina]